MLDVRDLAVSYGPTAVLRGVSRDLGLLQTAIPIEGRSSVLFTVDSAPIAAGERGRAPGAWERSRPALPTGRPEIRQDPASEVRNVGAAV
jgi:hypothetical protein